MSRASWCRAGCSTTRATDAARVLPDGAQAAGDAEAIRSAATAKCSARLSGLVEGHGRGTAALDELEDIVRACASGERRRAHCGSIRASRAGCRITPVRFSRSTCPIWPGASRGGGRYDELIGMFLGEHVPACGISLGLERILVVMAERGMFPESLVAHVRGRDGHHLECRCAADAIRLAGELRARGLACRCVSGA